MDAAEILYVIHRTMKKALRNDRHPLIEQVPDGSNTEMLLNFSPASSPQSKLKQMNAGKLARWKQVMHADKAGHFLIWLCDIVDQ